MVTPVTQVNKLPPVEHVITIEVPVYKDIIEKLNAIEQRLIEIEKKLLSVEEGSEIQIIDTDVQSHCP